MILIFSWKKLNNLLAWDRYEFYIFEKRSRLNKTNVCGREEERQVKYQQQGYQQKRLYSQVLQQTHQRTGQVHQQNPSSTTYIQLTD